MTEASPLSTTIELTGHTFTHYPRSGGIVITLGPTVIDAGIIGTPGPITRDRLRAIALRWLMYRDDYWSEVARMKVLISNRPTKHRS